MRMVLVLRVWSNSSNSRIFSFISTCGAADSLRPPRIGRRPEAGLKSRLIEQRGEWAKAAMDLRRSRMITVCIVSMDEEEVLGSMEWRYGVLASFKVVDELEAESEEELLLLLKRRTIEKRRVFLGVAVEVVEMEAMDIVGEEGERVMIDMVMYIKSVGCGGYM
ncbi:MAG: hypothetical protein JOS17DRAFT_330965 [Linnemannia elongata]|nr:MAG: hypothetical protein JOS17DRAFT_330965 [Linnemannia elongata]